MADETVKVIRIEVGDSEQTVKGLRDSIDALRQALEGATKGTQEFKDILDQLATNQAKLTKAMSTGKKETQAAEGSYNALAKKLSELKKAWKETTDETARGKLGKEINATNDQLKKMDASVGDFRRNVGNYAGSVKEAFGQMGGAAKGMTGPLASVKQAFTALAAHPLVAVLTALAALLINGIAKGFKSSEEATNKLRVAFAGFQAIGDAMTKMFQGIANVIANIVSGIVNLLEKWGWLSKEFKNRKKIAEDEVKLEQEQVANIRKIADLEKTAAENREKAADESKYTAQERLGFLQQSLEAERDIADLEYQALQEQYNIAKQKWEINKADGELQKAKEEAYAAMTRAEINYLEKKAAVNKKVSALNKQMISDSRNKKEAMLNLEKELIQQEYELAKKGSDDQLRLAKELRTKELQIQLEGLKSKIKNTQDYNTAVTLARKKYNQDIANLEIQFNSQQVEREVEHLRNMAATLKDGSKEQYEMLANAERTLFRKAQQRADETDQEFKDRLQGYNNNIRKFQDAALQAEETQVALLNRLILDSTKPLSEYYRTQISQMKTQLDTMVKYATETDEEYQARQNALEKEIMVAQSNYWQALQDEAKKRLDVANTIVMNGMENIFTNMRLEVRKSQIEWEAAEAEVFEYIKDNGTKLSNELKELVEKGVEGAFYYTPQQIAELWAKGLEEGLNNADFANLFSTLYNMQLIPESAAQKYLEGPKTIKDKMVQYNEELKQSYMDLAQYIGQCFSAIGDIYSINLENRKKKLEKDGKYNEQERKNLEEQYKKVQAMKIAEATINTISGALAALTSPVYQNMGAIGMALAAAQAAAVTLAGIAQIAQIKSTNPYSDSSSSLSSSGGMSATVTPTVSDFQPDYTTNLTGRSDTEYLQGALGKTNLWVSVVDINSAQEQGRVRVAESSF